MAQDTKSPAVAALLDYRQADEDGVMVLVSRQAIHEVTEAYGWMFDALSNLENDAAQMPDFMGDMVQAALFKARGES